MSQTSTASASPLTAASQLALQGRRRREMVLFLLGIAVAWLLCYVWSVDFRRRNTESFTTIAAVGCALLTSTVVLFAASVLRWRNGRGIAGAYGCVCLLVTSLLAVVVFNISGVVIFLAGGVSSNIGATGVKQLRFWNAADILLFHSLFLVLCGAVIYLVYIDKQAGLIPPAAPAPQTKPQFGLRQLLLGMLVIAVCTSGVAQWRANFTRFDTQIWSGDKWSRRYMVDDLLRRYSLVNLSYDEIWKLLYGPNGSGDSLIAQVPGRGILVIRFPHSIVQPPDEKREVLDCFVGNKVEELRSLQFGGRHPPVKLGPRCDLETVYQSFRLTPIIPSQLNSGPDRLSFEFSLENQATSELNPTGNHYAPGYSMIGRLQQWLVHPDGRTENAGTWAIPARVFAPKESFPPFVQDLSTLGYRRGNYRWIVELQSVEGKVLDSVETPFTVP